MTDKAPTPRCWVVIPAAGSGRRMGAGEPKQYLMLAGATVLEHTLKIFIDHPQIAGIVVALAPDDRRWDSLPVSRHASILRTAGGDERANSVLNGLNALSTRASADDWVLVHDAARPCLSRADLDRLIDTLKNDPVGGLLALPSGDTLKRSAAGAVAPAALETLDRTTIWRAQTPQMFRYGVLQNALTQALASGVAVTDEAAAVERTGLAPKLVEGSSTNIKITRPEDLALAESALGGRTEKGNMRIGSGYDIHAFGPGDHVMLGGVRIPHTHGVRAHSDGDVIIHALCDALLGAMALGDIGQHFPDSDPKWRGAASSLFLKHVVQLLADRNYRIVNVDLTLLAERPRLGPHRDAIKKTLASLMSIDTDAVNIKATTYEGLGPIGRSEGLAAQATALIERR